MGETRINLKIYGANGQAEELEAVADTGATFSKIPESVVTRLGLEAKYETEVELGDGRVIKRKLTLVDMENVIPNFFYWAMNGQPLPITGDGIGKFGYGERE
ncbi:MAG: hypothetical protein DDT31_01389 [Syntrophomonadaceae bacterium]|nr:hypothetical protein [Bacillota bacterium]MBT9138812.1 hypothetical protein [Bacillota bacterium]